MFSKRIKAFILTGIIVCMTATTSLAGTAKFVTIKGYGSGNSYQYYKHIVGSRK